MKKITLFFVALLTATIAFAYDAKIDGIYYNLNNKTKTAEVTYSSREYVGNIVIPEKVTYNSTEYNVTSIGDSAFYNCDVLPSITIPNSVTSIGDYAFYHCKVLTSISIPNNVTSIGDYAFYRCHALTSITIPSRVTSIKKSTFAWCSSLTSIIVNRGNQNYTSSKGILYDKNITTLIYCPGGKTSIKIPNSVTSISDSAFYYCSSLTSITIPNSVTSIREHAFDHCTSLTSITIPNSVTSIENYVFHNCKSLTSITIPNSVTSIGEHAFDNCTSLTSITIPNSVTSIGERAFSYCSSLTSITIPNSVTSIEGSAFKSCSSLTSINVDAKNPNYTSIDGILYNKDITTLICYPVCKTYISIPNSVTSIGSYAFSDFSSLTSITIPNSVTSIGDGAFYNCSSLTSISIPNSVTYIGSSAFFYCSSLTSITIPNNVTSIENYVFYNCRSLTSITIPNSVTAIGEHAFVYCTSLTSITIPNSVTSIGNWAFGYCSSLTSITIGNSVTSIGEAAFSDCYALTSISIPNSVTAIGKWAFNNCSYLESITIPNSVTYIGAGAFYGTPWFNNQPDGCIYIGKCLYKYKGKMPENTNIDIKKGTTMICSNSFYNCSTLTSITIPNSVTSIGECAFDNCTSLTSISIQAKNPPIITKYPFKDVHPSVFIEIPCGSKEKYQTAEYWKEFMNYEETITPILTVNVNDKNMGFATITKQNNSCEDNIAQVQAQALTGYEFVKWSDGSTENPHILLITEDISITAEFKVASTPVENTLDNQIKIYTTNGILHIEGATENYHILDAAGRLIYSGNATTLQLPRGIYIIRINDKSQKIVL